MPISGLLKGMNAIFDTSKMDPGSGLGEEFRKSLVRLEKSLIIQMTGTISPDTLTDSTYFFCKFKFGSDHFWQSIEKQIEKQARGSLNVQ